MKIVEIHTHNLGAVPNGKLSLMNDWRGEVENRVLLTGVNGCGKSTLLRAIAMMWEALGYWLERKTFIGTLEIPEKISDNHHNIINSAIILENIENITGKIDSKIGLFLGDSNFYKEIMLQFQHQNITWIGEIYNPKLYAVILGGNNGATKKFQSGDLLFPNSGWFDEWGNKLRLSKISNNLLENFPNICYLDAEKRRWVKPNKNIGTYVADNLNQRWLTKYEVSEEWQGQLEQSLINLKLLDETHFTELIGSLNQFLGSKEIQIQPKQIGNTVRLIVKAKSGEYEHGLDELSSGEHQVLIMLFLMLRWLNKGGIVLIDEPDLFLHPSLVSGFLSTLELEAERLGAQLIITSHSDDVWRRYENFGVRIDMSGGEYNVR